VTTERGQFVDSKLAEYVMATVHPSSILRVRTPDERLTPLGTQSRTLVCLTRRHSVPGT